MYQHAPVFMMIETFITSEAKAGRYSCPGHVSKVCVALGRQAVRNMKCENVGG